MVSITRFKNSFLVTTSYEGSDDEKELKPIPIVNNNKNVNVVTDSESDGNVENDNNFFL